MSDFQKIATIQDEFIGLYKELQNQNSAPDFVVKLREKGWDNFQSCGLPGKKNEDYKYTNVKDIFNTPYFKKLQNESVDIRLEDLFQCDVPDINTELILLHNGAYYSKDETLKQRDDGLIIGSLAEAFLRFPELVKKHLGKHAELDKNGLVGLNTAFVNDGVFIYVPKNLRIEIPFQVVNILTGFEDLMTQHRNLIVLENNSQLNLVICDHTLSTSKFLTNSVSEIVVGENSKVDISRIQNEHNESVQLTHTFIHQEKNSSATSNFVTLHGGIIRNNIRIKLNGEGCESNTYGLYLSDREQHIDNYVFVEHAFPNCTSNQMFKGVLDDKAIGAFNGRILVQPDAQKTMAFQANNNILLTDDAKMHTKPQLEIYADDVKCSHGATVGPLPLHH